MLPSATRSTLAAGLLALLLALAVGGCGSSSPGPDPASVVPASTPLYLSAVLRPSGSLKSDTLADARKLTRLSEPFAGLTQVLQSPGGRKLNYATDVKPWLGSRAGAFVSSLDAAAAGSALMEALGKTLSEGLSGTGVVQLAERDLQTLLATKGVQGALVLGATDVTKARAFLAARARETGAHAAAYRGISYQVAADGTAAGIVGSFAVIGSEAALHEVIDTRQGGAAIAHAPGYLKLTATAEPGALANVYLNVGGLLGTAAGAAPSASRSTGAASLAPLVRGALAGTEQAYLSLLPAANSLALDIDTIPSPRSSAEGLLPGTGAAQAAAQLPGGSWLAAGIGDVGALGQGAQGLDALASLLGNVSIGSFNLQGLFVALHSRDIDVRRDLLSWIGSAGVFAAGASLVNLQAGIVFSAKEPALASAAVAKIARAYRDAGAQVTPTTIPGAETAITIKLPNFPVVIGVGYGQNKLALGLGPASVQEALSPASTLSSSAAYSAAAATLGHGIQPSVVVDFPTMLSLIEALGLTQAQGVSGIVPYLQSLTTLSAGGGQSLGGGVKRARVVLGLTQTG
ncbi:MAG TPA: DUF3352 domain-containing protein [Solirubrobacteraceae bacterium]